MRRLLTAVLLALPLATQAWGPDGHQTVAALAAGLLKGTATEARMQALLGDMTLAQASLWADCAKGISPSQGYTYPSPGKYPECAPLETPARIATSTCLQPRRLRTARIAAPRRLSSMRVMVAGSPSHLHHPRLSGTAGTSMASGQAAALCHL